jgi:cytochrome c-type biogenesis protein CcmH/NrfF
MLATMLALVLPLPLAAQSQTGPADMGYDAMRPAGGHYHVGEVGEKLLAVEQHLRCNCGSCALDIHSCQFQMQCGTSPVWSQRILRSLEAGESPEAIEAAFVAEFGTTVLMAPPAEGFNLVGYLLPAVAIITAGMLIGLIVRGGAVRPETVGVRQLDDEEAARLAAALRALDESEGPDW